VPQARVGGFIMPANAPGAGMQELVTALISGTGAMVKTSHREPVFFPAFAQTLREVDPIIGSLLEVIPFGRERSDLVRIMEEECDFIVALGDDASLTRLSGPARLFGFGSRTSGALISLVAPANFPALVAVVARDVTLFEQQGCLSPQHVFIEDADGAQARDFARWLADALNLFATNLPSAKLSFNTAAAIRRIRERARWRGIGEHGVELFEGADMAWTVVFDPAARFTMSPGYRTVTVSSIRDADDLASRLAPVAGRLEAFGLAASSSARPKFLDVLAGAGVTYLCDPGKMQSPPLNWPHGGGAFLDFLATRNE
jgi:Acyl-CoA reductase (LuxC)